MAVISMLRHWQTHLGKEKKKNFAKMWMFANMVQVIFFKWMGGYG